MFEYDSTFENRITNLTFEIPSLNCTVTLAIFFYNGDLRRCDREKMVYGLATSIYGLRLRAFLLVHSLTGFPAATFTRVISNARPTPSSRRSVRRDESWGSHVAVCTLKLEFGIAPVPNLTEKLSLELFLSKNKHFN